MTKSKVLHYVSALILVVLLVLQFVPFWQVGEAEDQTTVSISSYIWMPSDNKALDKQMESTFGKDYSLNDVILCPVLVLVLCAVGAVLCVMKPGKLGVSVLPTLAGLIGVFGYATTPALQLGMNWTLHLAVAALALVVGAASLVFAWQESK